METAGRCNAGDASDANDVGNAGDVGDAGNASDVGEAGGAAHVYSHPQLLLLVGRSFCSPCHPLRRANFLYGRCNPAQNRPWLCGEAACIGTQMLAARAGVLSP